jgi:uncharacterized protein YlxW (UPF0749 family)
LTSPVGLLDAIVRDALDPSYAEAAARHRAERAIAGTETGLAGGWSARWRRTSLAGAALLLGAGALAGIAISSEQKVIPEVSAARSALAGNADQRTAQVRTLEQSLLARQREVAALQRRQLQDSATGRSLQRMDTALAAAAAESATHGPGITVTVSNAPAAAASSAGDGGGNTATRPQGSTAGEAGQVTDRDLQDIVNALWTSGAQAISVGGVRLGPQTAIRTAGQTILVAFEPLRSPYVIRAVGTAQLQQAGKSGALLAAAGDPYLADLAVGVQTSSELTLPAATPGQVSVGQPLSQTKARQR